MWQLWNQAWCVTLQTPPVLGTGTVLVTGPNLCHMMGKDHGGQRYRSVNSQTPGHTLWEQLSGDIFFHY